VDKVSGKLAALIAGKPADTRVRLNVMVRRGLDAARLKSLSTGITQRGNGDPAEYFPINGVLSLESSLDEVESIASRPEVEWVDVEAVAPITELLD
jgi:hypothetical protein